MAQRQCSDTAPSCVGGLAAAAQVWSGAAQLLSRFGSCSGSGVWAGVAAAAGQGTSSRAVGSIFRPPRQGNAAVERDSVVCMYADVDISFALETSRSLCVSCVVWLPNWGPVPKLRAGRVCRVTSSGMHPAAVGVVRFILAWPARPGSVGSEPAQEERDRGKAWGWGHC